MDCAQYRRAILTNPHGVTPEMRSHRAGCQGCIGYAERLQGFEDRLDRALRVDISVGATHAAAGGRPLRSFRSQAGQPRRLRRGWLAAAASALLAVLVGGGLWLSAPGSSLAADVVSHMAGEPAAWVRRDVPVPQSKLEAVLGESHVRLKASAGLLTYANSCLFRGHQVPHVVVQSAVGPVTVMVLTYEAAGPRERFHDQGY